MCGDGDGDKSGTEARGGRDRCAGRPKRPEDELNIIEVGGCDIVVKDYA